MREITADQIETISCKRDEQETSITFLRDDTEMQIFTSDNTMVTKIKRVMQKNPSAYRCFEGSRYSDGSISGYFFYAKKKLLSLRVPKQFDESKPKRTYFGRKTEKSM